MCASSAMSWTFVTVARDVATLGFRHRQKHTAMANPKKNKKPDGKIELSTRPPRPPPTFNWTICVGVSCISVGAALFGDAAWRQWVSPEPILSSWVPSSKSSQASDAAPSPPTPLAFFAGGVLQSFSAAHNESLLWGTYRPGVYFGLRSLTAPTGLVAGLMWASHAGHDPRMDKM